MYGESNPCFLSCVKNTCYYRAETRRLLNASPASTCSTLSSRENALVVNGFPPPRAFVCERLCFCYRLNVDKIIHEVWLRASRILKILDTIQYNSTV